MGSLTRSMSSNCSVATCFCVPHRHVSSLSTVSSDVTNLVTVETLLELVGTRLGIKLVPVIFGLRLPLALFAFSFFALAILDEKRGKKGNKFVRAFTIVLLLKPLSRHRMHDHG